MNNQKAIELARLFHETYERLAPSFGYKTRKASAVPWDDVPEQNKKLMIAVAEHILAELGKQPVCKTCGGSKIVLSHDGKPCSKGCQGHVSHPCEECGRQWPVMEVPCPDCKQPEAGEFTLSKRNYIQSYLEGTRYRITTGIRDEEMDKFAKWLIESFDRIDQLEADKERLIKDLLFYGCHSQECVAEKYPEAWHCICGFDQALKER